MSATFLEGGFQTPAFPKIKDNLLSSLRLIRGKQGLWRTLALRIAREHPADGQRIRARAIPQRRGCADFHDAFAFAVPIHRNTLPHRLVVMPDRLERWQTLANHTRTTDGVLGARFGR